MSPTSCQTAPPRIRRRELYGFLIPQRNTYFGVPGIHTRFASYTWTARARKGSGASRLAYSNRELFSQRAQRKRERAQRKQKMALLCVLSFPFASFAMKALAGSRSRAI